MDNYSHRLLLAAASAAQAASLDLIERARETATVDDSEMTEIIVNLVDAIRLAEAVRQSVRFGINKDCSDDQLVMTVRRAMELDP